MSEVKSLIVVTWQLERSTHELHKSLVPKRLGFTFVERVQPKREALSR